MSHNYATFLLFFSRATYITCDITNIPLVSLRSKYVANENNTNIIQFVIFPFLDAFLNRLNFFIYLLSFSPSRHHSTPHRTSCRTHSNHTKTPLPGANTHSHTHTPPHTHTHTNSHAPALTVSPPTASRVYMCVCVDVRRRVISCQKPRKVVNVRDHALYIEFTKMNSVSTTV